MEEPPTAVASIDSLNAVDFFTSSAWKWPIVRRLLGFVLFAAAILKAYELATIPLLGNGVLNQRWSMVCLVEVETVWGVWLLVGWAERGTWSLTFLMWLGFLGVAGYEAISGADSCGCFGRIHLNPWSTSAFDLVAVFALLLCRPRQRKPVVAASHFLWRWVFIGFAATAAGIFGIWDIFRYSESRINDEGLVLADGMVVLEPEKWVGKPFLLSSYIDVGSKLVRGNWTVLLYRYDCDHCKRAIPRYTALAGQKTRDGLTHLVALIEIPPYAPNKESMITGGTAATWGRLSESRSWFASTPVAIKLHNGVVMAVITSDAAEDPRYLL